MDTTAIVQLVEAAREGLKRGDQEYWLGRLDESYGAIESAFERSLVDGDADAALTFSADLQEYWSLRSKLAVGCAWLTRALRMKAGTTKHRASALHTLGELEFARGNYEESVGALG
jgi:hypothetical protein